MNLPDVVSRDEWLVARKALLAEEKEFTKRRDALNTRRRELPMVLVDKPYVFTGPDGSVGLADLFEGRMQLVVYHFMFQPEWDAGCPNCTGFVDEIGSLEYLHGTTTTFALVSRAPYEKLAAYRAKRGWNLPWYSSRWTSRSCRSSTTTGRRPSGTSTPTTVTPRRNSPSTSTASAASSASTKPSTTPTPPTAAAPTP